MIRCFSSCTLFSLCILYAEKKGEKRDNNVPMLLAFEIVKRDNGYCTYFVE